MVPCGSVDLYLAVSQRLRVNGNVEEWITSNKV